MTIDFETKDSGQHAEYASGMRRDTQEGKPRFALMVTKLQPYEDQMLTRYAKLLARGAEKYDDRNWEEGNSDEELERAKDSLLRHTMQLIAGERDEDHAAAVWFNTQAIEYFRWRLRQVDEDSEDCLYTYDELQERAEAMAVQRELDCRLIHGDVPKFNIGDAVTIPARTLYLQPHDLDGEIVSYSPVSKAGPHVNDVYVVRVRSDTPWRAGVAVAKAAQLVSRGLTGPTDID